MTSIGPSVQNRSAMRVAIVGMLLSSFNSTSDRLPIDSRIFKNSMFFSTRISMSCSVALSASSI